MVLYLNYSLFLLKKFLTYRIANQFITQDIILFRLLFSRKYLFLFNFENFFFKNISLLGTLIFIIHPRIFAQSFYNSKDIIFLVFFCISNFFLIKYFLKQNIKNIFLLSLSISVAICIRPMAIIIPFLFIFFFIMQNFEKSKYRNFILLIIFYYL